MATYYVRTDGNNSNAGTGSSTSAAWATVAHALGGTGTASGVVGGDTIYIAPGKYAGLIVGVSPSSILNVIGDPSATQFANAMLPGPVYISNTQDRSTAAAQVAITISNKNNFLFRNLVLGGMTTTASHNLTIDRCYMHMYQEFVSTLIMTFSAGVNANLLISNSFFQTGGFGSRPVDITCSNHTAPYQSTIRIYNCDLMDTASSNAIKLTSNNAYDIIISNCLIQMGIEHTGTYSSAVKVINTVLQTVSSNTTGNIIENYNMFLRSLSANRTNVTAGFNSFVANAPLLFGDVLTQNSLGPYHKKTPSETVFNQLIGYGTDTDAPTTDFFGRIYSSPRPIGLLTPSSLQGTSSYFPSERNASTITIAPGSTSQSIELYLGATGLTASTSGLSARYNRTRTASVSIPLVARTIAQAWTSGGFAEVDATNMPGVYRLDLPDAALAAGADDVTVVVRGASGTNGAVMTVKLSSGGLTSAQTASAVWGADVAGYVAETNFGGVVNATRNVSGNTEIIAQDIPSNVWEEVRANHTTAGTFGEYVNTSINTGAIADAVWDEARSGHTTAGTFGQYVNAELVTPVTQSASVRPGPFLLRAGNGIAGDPLDIQKGSVASIDLQCVDANSTGVDITGATVTTKVYNTAGTLVATYTNTSSYSAGGRTLCPLDATVTGTAGTYTANVWVVSGSTTTIYGPLRLYVRDI